MVQQTVHNSACQAIFRNVAKVGIIAWQANLKCFRNDVSRLARALARIYFNFLVID